MELNKIHNIDCLEFMKTLPDKCIDLVLTDPPYGTTGNEWDNVVDFWKEVKRISKGGQVIFSGQPYTTDLISSNRKEFKYHWIWNKCLAGNGILAKRQPLKIHEEICVFGNVDYYPIMKKGIMRTKNGIKDKHGTFNGATSKEVMNDDYYPESILRFSGASMRSEREHPTQKPVDLIAYLVKTYSKENDIIFDPFIGSGTTAVACKMLKRNYIGCEISKEYCEIAEQRIKSISNPLF